MFHALLGRSPVSGVVEVGVVPRFCCAGRAARRAEGAWGDHFAGRSSAQRAPGQHLEPISTRK